MGIFRRSPRSLFPADMVRWLDRFGRYTLDPASADMDSSRMAELMPLFLEYAQGDRERFLAELRDVVAGDEGGFATYGAARLVFDMFDAEMLTIPSALPLVDGGIRFLLARGVEPAMMNYYEMERFAQIRDQFTD
jgi:hypothetical protein